MVGSHKGRLRGVRSKGCEMWVRGCRKWKLGGIRDGRKIGRRMGGR